MNTKQEYQKPDITLIELEVNEGIMSGSVRGSSLLDPGTQNDEGGSLQWGNSPWGK